MTRVATGLGHAREEIAGKADTPGTRLGVPCAAQDAGAGRGRRRNLVDHNGPGNEGAVRGTILKVRFQ